MRGVIPWVKLDSLRQTTQRIILNKYSGSHLNAVRNRGYWGMKAFVRAVLLCSSSVTFAMGCAPKEKEHVELFQVDDTFLPYVQNFETVSSEEGREVRITDLILSFGPTNNITETGVCEIATNETPRVTINQGIWNGLNNNDRQEVIFHELGHCVLRRRHQEGEIRNFNNTAWVPASIMYPYRIPGAIYIANVDHYHGELFSKANEF
jgi:hypothetical protein